MLRCYELSNRIKSYEKNFDEQFFTKAYMFSMRLHKNQMRKSGDFYFIHPLEVSNILIELQMDEKTIIAGLLHDVIEDTEASHSDINELFGKEVADLVEGLTKIKFKSKEMGSKENLNKLIMAISSDIRVLIIKLADRLHNTRTLRHIKNISKRQKIARETLDLYVPMSERIGISKIKEEMENLAFSHLYPDVYKSISSRVNDLCKNADQTICKISQILKKTLESDGIEAQISGRLKTPYSIWRKMQKKTSSIDQLSDIIAFRAFVDTQENCYKALGILHKNFSFVSGGFRDYISVPKPNNYKSLHSCIIGPNNYVTEIQIRTLNMHIVNEFGIAAHWKYKRELKTAGEEESVWIDELLGAIKYSICSKELFKYMKLNSSLPEIFCFTPQGQLIKLKKGSTVIDFAYSIHTEIGNHLQKCKVNKKNAHIFTELIDGDIVKVFTSHDSNPVCEWEKHVTGTRAKFMIKRYLKMSERDQIIEKGRAILRSKLLKCKTKTFFNTVKYIAKKSGYKNHNNFLYLIGKGEICVDEALKVILEKSNLSLREKVVEDIQIQGVPPNITVNYASCCCPVYGDCIVGIIFSKDEIRIHTKECKIPSYANSALLVTGFKWGRESESKLFTARIRLSVQNKQGALANIASSISRHDGNITDVVILQRMDDLFGILVEIEVANINQLMTIEAELNSIKEVDSALRV